jgi:hypothetical protein
MTIVTSCGITADAWKFFRQRRVTYRTYGLHGEKRRPMFHRFEVKGGVTPLDVMAENVIRHNALFRALVQRGKYR